MQGTFIILLVSFFLTSCFVYSPNELRIITNNHLSTLPDYEIVGKDRYGPIYALSKKGYERANKKMMNIFVKKQCSNDNGVSTASQAPCYKWKRLKKGKTFQNKEYTSLLRADELTK